MALTRGFRVTLLARAQKDAEFRQAMLKEGIDTLLAGDVETGKAILRGHTSNAAVGFKPLAEATNIPAKSLMRMFGPKGNPRADNLFQIIQAPASPRRHPFGSGSVLTGRFCWYN